LSFVCVFQASVTVTASFCPPYRKASVLITAYGLLEWFAAFGFVQNCRRWEPVTLILLK